MNNNTKGINATVLYITVWKDS